MAIIPIDQLTGEAKEQTQTQPSGNIIPIDQLVSEGEQQEVGGITQGQFETLPDANTRSPISIIDRMRLSFADDAGREAFLRERFQFVEKQEDGKFAVGNDASNLLPIDPSGVFNDVLGDIADVVAEIPVIAGQIGGGLLGATAGPGGLIVGGAAGAAGGAAIKQGIGKFLGVNERNAQEIAIEIGLEGLFGAAGEALAVGTKALAGRVIAPKLTKLLGKAVRENKNPGALVRGLAKLFKVTANVNENSTLTAFKHGIEDTLGNAKFADENAIIPLMRRALTTIDDTTRDLGKKIVTQTNSLLSKSKGEIDITDLYNGVRRQLQGMQVLNETGEINIKALSRDVNKNIKFGTNLLGNLGALPRNTKRFPVMGVPDSFGGVNKQVKMPMKKVLGLISELSDEFDRITPRMKAVVTQVQNGLDTGEEGLRQTIRRIAREVGNEDYINSMDSFAKFAELKEQLPQFMKGGKPTEQFIRRLENITVSEQQALNQLDARAAKPFLKELEQWNAAQDFKLARPDFLRMGAIAGILGSAVGFEGKPSRGAVIGGALLLGTPSGAKFLLRSGSKAAKVLLKNRLKQVGRVVPQKVQTPAASALLSQLLQLSQQNQQSGNQNVPGSPAQ